MPSLKEQIAEVLTLAEMEIVKDLVPIYPKAARVIKQLEEIISIQSDLINEIEPLIGLYHDEDSVRVAWKRLQKTQDKTKQLMEGTNE